MPNQIILTLHPDGGVTGEFDEELTYRDIAWMLKCAEVDLNLTMANSHTDIRGPADEAETNQSLVDEPNEGESGRGETQAPSV